MKYNQWIDVKNMADRNNAATTIKYNNLDNFCEIWIVVDGDKKICKIKNTSEEYTDFQDNYKPYLVATHDIYHKPYTRIFSANQDTETICLTSQGDDTENQIVGEGLEISWDASKTTGPRAFDTSTTKVIDINFIDQVRIFGGKMSWINGDLDCTGDCMITCPEGCILQLDANGVPFYAPWDWNINWYARKIPMLDKCSEGYDLAPEGASELVPTNLGWVVRFIITKPAENVTFAGKIVLKIYRKSNV